MEAAASSVMPAYAMPGGAPTGARSPSAPRSRTAHRPRDVGAGEGHRLRVGDELAHPEVEPELLVRVRAGRELAVDAGEEGRERVVRQQRALGTAVDDGLQL